MVKQGDLFDFDGVTYDPGKDQHRLNRQLGRVYDVLSDERWHTLKELKLRCMHLRGDGKFDSEAGISARIQDLRKIKFGRYRVDNRRIDGGLWEYRLKIS